MTAVQIERQIMGKRLGHLERRPRQVSRRMDGIHALLGDIEGAVFGKVDDMRTIPVVAGIENIAIAFDVPIEEITVDGRMVLTADIPALGLSVYEKR